MSQQHNEDTVWQNMTESGVHSNPGSLDAPRMPLPRHGTSWQLLPWPHPQTPCPGA